MKGGFGKSSGSVTPKDQSGHGKARGQTESVVPPAKKGPPHIDGAANLPKANEHGTSRAN